MSELAIIAAVAKNGVIGINGGLPWRLRADLKWFKQCTSGNTVVMGRKTFESIGKALPDRQNIVLSRDPKISFSGGTGNATSDCSVCPDLDSALAIATGATVFVIGGAQIYRQALPQAAHLYLTVVNANVEGDTWFPFVDLDDWMLMSRTANAADEHNQYDCEFRIYRRR